MLRDYRKFRALFRGLIFRGLESEGGVVGGHIVIVSVYQDFRIYCDINKISKP